MEGVYEIYVAMAGGVKNSARIRIDAAGGNDVVAVSTNVPLKASLSGGWGADKLTSGKRRSILYGGGGGDRLFSRSRAGGCLDGGKGADRYFNRFGEVEIMGRNDGDCLMVNGNPVGVTQCGIFGIDAVVNLSSVNSTPGHCYFYAADDETKTDLLN
jgi:Ca2+-binding RTX toxin-like protein